jgi:ABC-type polysaccharide/polyol phosphate transport system ATPase subunit
MSELTNTDCYVRLENICLDYSLYHDKTNSLKEFFVTRLARKKYVSVRKEKLRALDHINLNIEHGDRVGIIGLNGAGKSTLLKVISGIYKPTSGALNISGAIQPLIEVGAGFDPELTGRENIYLNGYMLGFTKKDLKAVEEQIIKFSELDEFIDVPIKYYSTGMAVRLAFTIATIVKPEILVFDEMLAAGDAAFIDKAKRRLDQLMDAAKIMIIVSHDLIFVENVCNRLIILERGKMIFDGGVKAGLQRYNELVMAKRTDV